MSSSSVCQGLQSCLEPRVIEPRVLRLKLAPPGSNYSQPSGTSSRASSFSSSSPSEKENSNHECDKKDTIANMEGHGWSFLQALSNTSHCSKNKDEKVYVHPTIKRTSSVHSAKSLEMCTESLGSETGSNASESSDEVSFISFESSTRHNTTNRVSKRVNKACSFPPPLTSITDFGGVHVRSHREGGRLILEAVASPSPRPYFHAERGDGRLRLSLFEGHFASDDDDEVATEEWSHEEKEEGESEKKQEACGEEKEEDSGVEEELEECIDNVEDEMGVTKFARPSRCKQSGNRDIFGDGYFELPSLSLCL